MKCKTQVEETILLSLTPEEAEMLKGLVQNPLPEESEEIRLLRKHLFEILPTSNTLT